MRKRGLSCRPVSVCLSVCLSVTLVYCIHRAEDIVKFLSHSGSPIILVFRPRVPIPNSKGNLFSGRKIYRDVKIVRFSTEFAVYLRNGSI